MAKPDHFTGKLLVDKSYVEASGFPAFQLFSTGEKALTWKPQTKLKGDRDTDSTDGQKLIKKIRHFSIFYNVCVSIKIFSLPHGKSSQKTPTQGILKCTIWNAGESSTEVPEYLNL